METSNIFDGLFGKVQAGFVRIDVNGNVAVKTQNGYKSYSLATGNLINCDQFVFDVGEEFFFVIPTNNVKPGDIILANGRSGKRTPKCVIDVAKTYITVINYEDAVVENIVPERHFFMGDTFFYGKIVSLINVNGGNGTNPIENVLKFKMMGELLNGKGFGGSGGDFMSTMLFMNMMGGGNNNFSNMFNFDNMFNGFGNATAPAPADTVTPVPVAATPAPVQVVEAEIIEPEK